MQRKHKQTEYRDSSAKGPSKYSGATGGKKNKWFMVIHFMLSRANDLFQKKKEMTWNIQRYVNTEQVYSKGKWQEMLPFLNMAS